MSELMGDTTEDESRHVLHKSSPQDENNICQSYDGGIGHHFLGRHGKNEASKTTPTSSRPSSASHTPTNPSTPTEHERQTLLLMLLAQVCSLHDATPRTFVVHVLALFERGILDSNSIRFLFDLGLVPSSYNSAFNAIEGAGVSDPDCSSLENDEKFHAGSDSFGDSRGATNIDCGQRFQSNHDSDFNDAGMNGPIDNHDNNVAIVPYRPNQHHLTSQLQPPLSMRKSQSSLQPVDKLNSKKLAKESMLSHRQKEASAIRKHLEHQDSLNSSTHGSMFRPNFASLEGRSVSGRATSSNHYSNSSGVDAFETKDWKRADSSLTQNTLTSAEMSIDATPGIAHQNQSFSKPLQNEKSSPLDSSARNNTQHLAVTNLSSTPSSSWSVEHHPLSLSRYQREFHQVSLLASGSFGNVYHAIHKLEHRPYAIKRVVISTTGYYADTLALVIREVRCLAQLDHANCVRYYTSWLEPSWMTGQDHSNQSSLGGDDYEEGDESGLEYLEKCKSPKLLTDVERVVNSIHNPSEIPDSVEQLEAILYGSSMKNDEEKDTGFDWTSSNSLSGVKNYSAFSFVRSGKRNGANDWSDLPSHHTNRNDSMHSIASDSFGGDSDVSEWTHDLNGSSSGHAPSRRRSGRYHYERQGSLELVKAPKQNKTSQNNNCLGRNLPAGRTKQVNPHNTTGNVSSSYKYQICLFIQMQLCHPRTLADWIKQRNHNCAQFDVEERQIRAQPAFQVFRQIVHGLAHVHSKGIIHRDLKPANIFAGDDGGWRIGDFGLSKMIRDANNGVDTGNDYVSNGAVIPPWNTNDVHTAGVGTASYAAPEQISQKHYGPAADIFSLGLILLELFSNFTSEHERAKAFHECRHHGDLAHWMKRTYPEVSSLVLACTNSDWTRRPKASDIQSAPVFQEGGSGLEIVRSEVQTLKVEMARKDDVIQKQKEQLNEKDDIIETLKQALAVAQKSSNTREQGNMNPGDRLVEPLGVDESSDDDY